MISKVSIVAVVFFSAVTLLLSASGAQALMVPSSSTTTSSGSSSSSSPSFAMMRKSLAIFAEQQAAYGTAAELPGSYAQCGRCQSAFALKEEDLGANGKGRRLECSVCGHSWFQSKERLMTLNDGFEMIPLPVTDKDRIITNMKEGKSPKYTGDSKLYVGNISFESSEADLVALFAEVGQVGSVALVRDEQGRNRGFGFVTMRTKEDGEAAMEKLNGMELNGRNLAVRESNN